MHIYLLNADDRLLKSMDPRSSARAEKDLAKLGVKIMLKSMVTDM
jgi:NADH dehydrogenase